MPELTQRARQAAIEFCIARIAHLERCIEEYPGHPTIKVDLLVLQVALESLTAEPVAILDVQNSRAEDKFAMVYTRVGHALVDDTYTLYTTPPAQLLRPVELPEAFAYTIEGMEEYVDGWWLRKDDVIETLRQQGYEVKND